MDRGLGNEVQARAIAEQVAEAVIAKYPPPEPRAEIPAPLKWAAGIAAAVMTIATTGAVSWGVSTLNQLQITVARMDERQQQDTTPARLEKIEDRLARVEQMKQEHRP